MPTGRGEILPPKGTYTEYRKTCKNSFWYLTGTFRKREKFDRHIEKNLRSYKKKIDTQEM